MNTSLTRRLQSVALLGAAALAFGGLSATANPAFAAPGAGGTGSITVYKLEQPSEDTFPGTGEKVDDLSGLNPLVAGFTLSEVQGVDLSDAAAWERLRNLTVTLDHQRTPLVTENGTRLELTTVRDEQFTDSGSGATEFLNLPADRAYVVWESTRTRNAIGAAEPVLLTVPHPGPSGSGAWNYNPHIYPKSAISGAGSTKEARVIENTVEFTVTIPIQPLAAGQRYTHFAVKDKLIPALKHELTTVSLRSNSGDPVNFELNEDYVVLALPGGDGTVLVRILEDGLAKMDNAIGGTLIVDISARALASGNTANEAEVTVNGTSTEQGTGPQVLDPQDFFTGARIVKSAKLVGGAQVPLAGAEFAIYGSGAAACAAVPPAGETPVIASLRSGEKGETSPVVLLAGDYCVYEIGVPTGYKGLTGGVKFTVDRENASITIENAQLGSEAGDLPSLPHTGASGTLLLFAGGASLILLGVAIAIARKRARHGTK